MSINPLVTHASPYESLYLPANANITIGTDIQCSTITVAPQGYVLLDYDKANDKPAEIIFASQGQGDQVNIFKKVSNKDTNDEIITFPAFVDQNDYYSQVGASDLYIYSIDNPAGQNRPVGVLREDGGDGSLLIKSPQVRIDNLKISSINGAPYGGFTSNVTFSNVNTSTLTVYDTASIDNIYANYGEITDLAVTTINGQPYVPGGGTSDISSLINLRLSTLTASSINTGFIFGNRGVFSTLNVSSIFSPNLILPSTVSGNNALFSTLFTANVSSVFGNFTFNLVSTLAFNPSLGGFSPNVNLGLGGFLGGLAGGLTSGVFNTALAGAALGTGIAALTQSRPGNNINNAQYEMINATTQLQTSTLGTDTLSYFRFANTSTLVSSMLQLSSSTVLSSFSSFIIPGREVITSTLIAAGNTCIRSIGDPINLANPAIATSTVQAFGQWTVLPVAVQNVSTTVTFQNVVISTLTLDSIPGAAGNSVIAGGIPAPDPVSGYGINYNQRNPGGNEQEIVTASSDATGGMSVYVTDNTSGLGKIYNKIFSVTRNIPLQLGVITQAILSTTQIWGNVAFNAIPSATGTPVNPTDLTTKAYVDMIAGGGGGGGALYVSSFSLLTDGGSPPTTLTQTWPIPPGTKYIMAEVISGGGGTGGSKNYPGGGGNGQNSYVTFPDGFQVSANGGGGGSAPLVITNLTGSGNGNGNGRGNNAFAIQSLTNPIPYLMTSGDGAYNKYARDVTGMSGNLTIFVGNGGSPGFAGARGSAGTVWISYR